MGSVVSAWRVGGGVTCLPCTGSVVSAWRVGGGVARLPCMGSVVSAWRVGGGVARLPCMGSVVSAWRVGGGVTRHRLWRYQTWVNLLSFITSTDYIICGGIKLGSIYCHLLPAQII